MAHGTMINSSKFGSLTSILKKATNQETIKSL